MAYGVLKVDTITFTNGGVDKSIAISGLVQNPTFTGNVTVTGTISGNIIQGGTTVSGLTVTGTTANFASGVYTTQISGAIVKVPAGTAGAPTIQVGTGASVAPGLYSAGTDQLAISTGGASSIIVDSVGQLRVINVGTAAAPAVIVGNDLNTGIYSPGADQLAISTGGTGRLFVAADGKVGIGASPAVLFDVATADDTEVRFRATTNGVDVRVNALGLAGNAGQIGTWSNHPFVIRTNNTERLRVTADGKVGIGTSTPGLPLHVLGTIGSAPASTNSGFLLLSGNSGAGAGCTIESSFTSGGYGPLLFKVNNGEAARIDSSGRLLVGTSSRRRVGTPFDPTGGIFYEGSGAASYEAFTAVVNRNDSVGAVLSFGKSRGTVNGSNTIVADGDQLGVIRFSGADGTDLETIGATIEAAVDGTPGLNDMPGRLVFSTTADGAASPTERMRIDSAGNVGIGGTPGGYRLDVQGGGQRILSQGATSFLEIGHGTATNQAAFIDFITDTTYTDYGLRLIRDNAGANAVGILENRGTGELSLRCREAAPLTFFTTNTERARIDSSGRLLVGTSTSSNYLGTAQPARIQAIEDGGTFALGIERPTADAAPANIVFRKTRSTTPGGIAAVLADDQIGNIRFVATDGTGAIQAATIRCEVDSAPGLNDMPGRLVFSTTADGAAAPTERMRITSGGAVIVGGTSSDPVGTSASQVLACGPGASAGALSYYNSSGECIKVGRGTDGNIVSFFRNQPAATVVGTISVTTTATSYNTSSDYRLKENVTPVTDGITRLQQLKPSRFNFTIDPSKTVDGFLAHEVQTIVPEAITGTKDAVDDDGNPVYQGIDQSKLVPLLTAALQEAIGEIESLKTRLTAAGI